MIARALPACLFALLFAVPFLPWGRDTGSILLLATHIEILALAALSLDIILGGGGLVSFGHAAYLAIGAYAVAILDSADHNEAWIVLPAAMGAAALFAATTGVVALRTTGVNFIMITLAFAQIVFFAAGALSSLGGDDGYPLVERTRVFGAAVQRGRGFYYVAFVCLTLAYLFGQRLLASRFGRVLRAIRQNPQRVRAMGINPFPVQLTALVISGMIAAVAGVLLANLSGFVSPATGAWQRSGDLLIMVILGGTGSLHGAILGAATVVLLEEGLGHITEHWRIIYGPFLVLAVLFARGGLTALGRRHD